MLFRSVVYHRSLVYVATWLELEQVATIEPKPGIPPDPGHVASVLQTMKRTGARQDARLRRPVPLYLAYITAWATEDGVIQFRRDLYQKDGLGPVASAY